jgi:hypothetical protein
VNGAQQPVALDAALIQLLVSYFPPGHYRGNKQRTSSPNQAKSSRNASSFQNGE